jgi:hypothetical protein
MVLMGPIGAMITYPGTTFDRFSMSVGVMSLGRFSHGQAEAMVQIWFIEST